MSTSDHTSTGFTDDAITWEVELDQNRLTALEGADLANSGFTSEEWFGEGFWFSRIHPSDLQSVLDFSARAIRARQSYRFECRVVRSSGKVEWIESSINVVESDGRAVCLRGSTIDITDTKVAQLQTEAVESMDAVARLASGVAHNFNNLLTVIKTSTDLLARSGTRPDSDGAHLDTIRSAADAAAELVGQLLTFSTGPLGSLGSANINDAVTDARAVIRSEVDQNTLVTSQLDPEAPDVRADRSRLTQAITELARNASDALPDGGEIRISTRAVLVPDELPSSDLTPGNYIEVAISDNGPGIPDDVLPQVFQPFFTTRDLALRKGLGLTTVYGLANQSHGLATIESTEGKGTTAKILLPAFDDFDLAQATDGSAQDAQANGRETVLFVEDEEDIRLIGMQALERLGYEVLAAAEPDEALRIFAEQGASIDLLLTDVVMPTMYGNKLAERIREAKPSIPVLFVSGYAADILEGELAGSHFLPKPFTLSSLAAAVRQTIDDRPSTSLPRTQATSH